MRVLMLATQFGGRGGIQYTGRLVLRALRQWVGPDADLTALSLNDSPVDMAGGDASITFGGRNRLVAGWRAWQLLRQDWDLLLLGHIHLASLLPFVTPVTLPPVVGLIYGIEAWQPISGLRRRGLRKVDKILYISQHTRRVSEEWNPWLRHVPGAVCHLGLLPEDVSPVAATRASRCQTGRYAVAIGRMARAEGYKGFEELIRIWPRVERAHAGCKLILIGDGDDRMRLQELATELRAAVVFTGSIDDEQRDDLLRNCAALCLPSRGEGFGLVYLEAMRLGKPVLAGSTDAGKEVVVDGVTGRVVSGQDPEELLAGILDVLDGRGRDLGVAGRQRYVENFSYASFYERFTNELECLPPPSRSARLHAGVCGSE